MYVYKHINGHRCIQIYVWVTFRSYSARVFSLKVPLAYICIMCISIYIYMYSYSMYGWMDGRTDGGRDGWMDAWMHVWMNACMHVYIYNNNNNNIYIYIYIIRVYRYICHYMPMNICMYIYIYIYTCILDNTTKIYGLWWVMYIHRRGMKTTFTLCNLLIPQTPYIEP